MAAVMALVVALAAQSTSFSSDSTAVPDTENARKVGQRTYVDLEGGVGYSTNPQFSIPSDEGSGNGYVSVHAVQPAFTDRTTTLCLPTPRRQRTLAITDPTNPSL